MKKESVAIIDALVVYSNTLLLIIYFSAIETPVCRREMSLIWSTSFGFCTKYDTGFPKYGIEFIVALSSTNAKRIKSTVKDAHFSCSFFFCSFKVLCQSKLFHNILIIKHCVCVSGILGKAPVAQS